MSANSFRRQPRNPIVIEFGSCKINLGVCGDSLPSTSLDADAILTGNDGNDALFGLDACSTASDGDGAPLHHRHLFATAASDVVDVDVSAMVLRQMLRRAALVDSDSEIAEIPLVAVLPSEVFVNTAAFETWSQIFFAAGFRRFFPVRSAVAAAVETGRPTAVVLDVGHRSARVAAVVDGCELSLRMHVPENTALGGRVLHRDFESGLVSSIAAASNLLAANADAGGATGDTGSQQQQQAAASQNETNPVDSFFSGYLGSAAFPVDSPQQQLLRQRIVREALHRVGCVAPSRRQFEATVSGDNNNGGGNDDDDDDDDDEYDDPFAPARNNKNNNNSAATAKSDKAPVVPSTFVGPDGTTVELSGKARSAPFEALFLGSQSSSNNRNSNGKNDDAAGATAAAAPPPATVAMLAHTQFERLPPDVSLRCPLLVVGGLARADGFRKRFEQELRYVNSKFNLHSARFPTDPHPQWRGASFLGKVLRDQQWDASSGSGNSHNPWVTPAAMKEHGAERVRSNLP